MKKWMAFLSSLRDRLKLRPPETRERTGDGRLRGIVRLLPFLAVAAAAAVVALVLLLPRGPRPLEMAAEPPAIRSLEPGSAVPPLRVTFSGSAAAIELVGKDVDKGAHLQPAREGRWVWSSDHELTFFPAADWEPGVQYTARFDAALFAPGVRLGSRSVSVTVPAFAATVSEATLFIDPLHPEIKRLTATVSFTHPARVEELAGAVRMKPGFRVSWDATFTAAYIVSDPLPVPEKSYVETLKINGRLASSRGGLPFAANLEASITVPGRYDFAELTGIEAGLVRAETYQYQKVLVVTGTLGMRPEDVAKALAVWALPADRPASPGTEAEKNHPWDVVEIDPALLALSTRLTLTALPTENEYGTPVSFTYDAPSGRFLYLEQKGEIEAFGGYRIAAGRKEILQVPAIPKEVRIMHDGALLAMSGEKKISLFANDLAAVQFEVGRIIPDQVNNLITQTRADMKDITFRYSWGFGLENMAAIYREVRPLRTLAPGEVQYFSFDFQSYLAREDDARLRYGLFYFRVAEYDPVTRQPTEISNERLILVTDLGMLVKKTASGAYDLFVQSIHSGQPVGGAGVEVIGKNGLAVLTAVTGPDGHAVFPSFSGLTREKAPEAFVVKKGNDMSFLPVAGEGRFLNFSRFDTGGIYGAADPGFIDAFLFSDRGIYRPGEAVNVGIIVKAGDWGRDLAGLPLELSVVDPRGLEIQKKSISLSRSGFEQSGFSTQDTSATGTYEVVLSLARDKEERRRLGSVSVRVEDFQPDRLTIRSTFSVDERKAWVSPEGLAARVTLMNLYGTPAAGNLVQASLRLSPATVTLDRWSEYQFFDPLGAGKTFEESLADGRTGEDGAASFPLDLQRFDRATFLVRVAADGQEKQGGRSVHTESAVIVSPLSSLVGWKADGRLDYVSRGAARTVDFVSVGPDQAPVPLTGCLLTIADVRYVSVLEKGPDGLYRYTSVEKKVPLRTAAAAIGRDGYHLVLPTDASGDYEVTLDDKDGTRVSSFRYSVVGAGNVARTLDRNAELQVRLDRADYTSGDTIQLSIRAPYTGAGLVTIERDRVYAYRWFTTDSTASVQSIRVPEGIEGTAYVNVSFVRAIDSPEIYTSPLSYGVVPITVNKGRRSNAITLNAPAELLAGTTLHVGYRTAVPGKIVVYAVDEGILQVARYTTPRPLDHFFTKRALEVRTSQILDLVLPEYSLVQALSATGGDEGGAFGRNLNPFKRRGRPPVVFWSGILAADSVERTVDFAVPASFNGSLRIMAVAVADAAIGSQQVTTLVRNNYVISPNVPAVLTPGDQVTVGVAVMNNLPRPGASTAVRVDLKLSAGLEPVGAASATTSLGAKEEKTVFFTVKVKDRLGAESLVFTASGAGASSALEETVSVRPSVPARTEVVSGVTRNATTEVTASRVLHPEFRTVQAAVSALPAGMSYGLKQYLDSYPYGCTEQIVSRGFAVLALRQVKEFGVTAAEASAAFDQVQSVLRARQNQEGGFGLWAANGVGEDFVTAYAMHFLTEARGWGFPVDATLFNAGLAALGTVASRDLAAAGTSSTAAAYAIYVLTRNGVITTGPINALRASKALPASWKDGPVALFLAGSYALMKQAPEAAALLGGGFRAKWNALFASDYYVPLSHSSLALFLASRHVPSLVPELGARSIEKIAGYLQSGEYSTISSTFAVLALTSYAEASLGSQQKLTVQGRTAAGAWEELKTAGRIVLTADVPQGSSAVRLQNPTGTALYWQVVQSGFDTRPPAAAVDHGIEIFREYTDADGKATATARVGQELQVHLRLRSVGQRGVVTSVAVVDLLPAGFELVYDKAGQDAVGQGSLAVQFAEPREDRLLLFCSVDSGVKDFRYTIRALNTGTFAIPPAFAEAMYDRATWSERPAAGSLVVTE
jgi:alpha-2-macroglobulin